MSKQPLRKITWRQGLLILFSGMFLFVSVSITFPKKAQAADCCSCMTTAISTEISEIIMVLGETALHVIVKMLVSKKIFFKGIIWGNGIERAMKDMSDQLAGTAMQQSLIIGQFMDAETQLGTQQLFQTLQARVHRDYNPSLGLCEFASTARSLADSERLGEMNHIVMASRSMDRQLGAAYTYTARGPDYDKETRLTQFKARFCDPTDHNNGLGDFCNPFNNTMEGRERFNKDVDFARTVNDPYTLDINLYDSVITDNEEEVLALSANLYHQTLFNRPDPGSLTATDNATLNAAQEEYMDTRAMMAKMNVAENSFNAITSMKSAGAPGAAYFVQTVIEGLGVPADELEELVGENPSYYAQMEVLTKKLLQNPEFYTELYDKPVNVERKGVALQAISLMQKFDLFKSHLRNEANLSVLLELAVSDMQEEVENEINRQKAGGRESVLQQ